MDQWFAQLLAVPGLAWLILAAFLAIAELLAPGIFLVFIAAGAAATGVGTLLVPSLGTVLEVFLFAAASAAAVAIGRSWYRRSDVPSADPLLNDRIARLIGQTVTVVEPIEAGRGRVKVGDGEWPASGPDLPAGATVRIVGAIGASLQVEPA